MKEGSILVKMAEADPEVLKWLESLGMQEYVGRFREAEVDMAILPFFTQDDLVALGIECDGDRGKVFEACQKLRGFPDDYGHLRPSKVVPAASCRDVDKFGGWNVQEGRKGSSSRCENNGSVSEDNEDQEPEVHDLTNVLTQRDVNFNAVVTGCKRKHQTMITEFLGGRSGMQRSRTENWQTWKGSKWPRNYGQSLPEWQRVPGTSFIVDRFKSVWEVQGDTWFLTHFHADHYVGLTKSFRRGLIHCSPTTARLTNLRLGVPWNRLVEIEVGQTKNIKGVKVTFLDANHCPGAVMILFEPPNTPPVLHTGDCRLVQSMQSDPLLQAYRDKKALLVLDTTYCDPKYCFPPQVEVIKFVVDSIKSEDFSQDALILFGTYTIGKEKIFMEAAKALGKKIYMNPTKLQIMECLELSQEEKEMMTSDHEETNIHAVPMSLVRMDAMGKLIKRYRGKYRKVVGFQPTGWSFSKGMTRAAGKRRGTGNVMLYQVPYSEHSSFNELVEFVRWFDPIRIIPSVGNDEGPKTKQMLGMLRQKCILTSFQKHS